MEEEVEALLMDLNQVPLQDRMSLGRRQLLVEKSSPQCKLISHKTVNMKKLPVGTVGGASGTSSV